MLRLHTDSRVDNPGNQYLPLSITIHRQGDRPFFRKFKRVSTQIDNNLAQARRVSLDLLGQREFTEYIEVETFFLRPGGEKSTNLVQQLRQVHRYHVHIQLVGVDFGVVEDIIHQIKQVSPAPNNGLRAAALFLLIEIRVHKRLPVANYGRQRRSNLMAHIGEELTLGFCGIARKLLLQPFLFPFALDALAPVAFCGIDAGSFQVRGLAVSIVGCVE